MTRNQSPSTIPYTCGRHTLAPIAAALRSELDDPLVSPIPVPPNDYPALRPFADTGMLLDALDAEPLYGAERNLVLADLLRLAREPAAAAWARRAALYGVLPGIPRVLKRLRRSAPAYEPDDVFAEVLAKALDLIAAYDPERRSPNIQASLEHGVCCAVFRRRIRRYREIGAEIELATHFAHDPDAPSASVTPFPSTASSSAALEIDMDDVTVGRRMLDPFVAAGQLQAPDADLIVETRILGHTATAAGSRIGIDRRTVVRRVERALDRIGDDLRAQLIEAMPVSEFDRNSSYRRAW